MKRLLTFLTLLTLFIGVGWAADRWVKTAPSNLATGDIVVIADNSSKRAMTNDNGTSTAPDATEYILTNGEISSTVTDNMQWVVTKDGNNFKFQVNGTSNYLYCTNTNNGVRVGTNSNNIFTIAQNTQITSYNVLKNTATSRFVGVYNDSDWRCYTTVNENIRETNVFFYKKVSDGPTIETVATPTFDPAEGTYTEAQNVTISCSTSGATIYYTTNGSDPTTSSSVYSSAIAVSETTTIKAIAVKDGMNNSQVASATYTINIPQPSSEARFERINSTSDLEAGKRYLLVYETTPAGMGAITNNTYGASVTGSTNLTVTNGVATLPSGSTVKPLTLGGNATDGWTFDLDGALLNHTGSGNTLTTGTSNTTWTIAFSGNNATITNKTNTTRVIKYNSSSPRFACYTSGQQAIQLYKEVESTTSNKLYLIGNDMNSQSGWNISTGPEFTYNSSTGTYAVNAYFDMADRGYFQFVEGLSNNNSNWGGLTGRYYASSNDGDVPVDWYNGEPLDMDGTHGLYFTNSTQYSPGEYAFTIPAGLYTIVVDKNAWMVYVTQHPVTMTISPNSATFDDTKNVTLASNLTDLGGKIYYTTDGSTPSATNGTEYTGTITLDATTTIKAIAILNHIQSEVVDKTYTKTPAAPVISPASCTFNEPLTVTITAESGATIYYTTDGSDPTDQSTQYTGSFTVSSTTTVKAIAYVGEAYSNIATATYTYSNVQPSTGDFVLVTSADQLVAGNEYIIVTTYGGSDYAMGALTTGNNPKGSRTTDFTITGTVGTSGSRITAGSEVNVLTLGSTGGAWTLKQSDDKYITLAGNTNISAGTSTCNLTITIDDLVAKISGSDANRIILYQAGTSNCFGNYASSNVGGNNYSNIYLYTRATNSVQPPVFSPIAGIYNVDIDVTISCATNGATIYYTTDGTEPSATNGTEYTGEIIVSESTTFKAIAVKGDNSSSVVTAAYTIQKSTDIETVTLDYSEPFTAGIGKFFVTNNTGFSPVWTLDGNFGVKGTSYEPATGTNHAATSRLVSPIIDMTDAVQPEMTFSHQINSFFNDVTTQATLWIRETTNGTSGTWVQLPITFSDPAAAGGWTNDLVDIDLSDYAGKKVQISFLYTNPTEGSGAGTWEIQNFVVADNSEYRMVNNIAEFLALENGTKAKFKNPVTVLYDYAQYSSSSYHEYIWVKDESGYMQFYLVPTLNSSTESTLSAKAAYYENGDIIPAGFVVVKNYYENGKYVQAYSTEALDAGFELATQKGLADPDHYEFSTLNALTLSDADIAANCNRYITVEKVKIASKSGKNFTFANENGTVNACVGYNKYNGDGSLLKNGTTSADVTVPAVSDTYYNVKGIIQIWQGGWEFMPIEFTEWKADEVTLRKLCADGVENNEYKISNNLMCVFAKGNSIWVKDDTGQSIWPDAPDANYKDNFPINAEGNTRLDQALYDQSNWCEIQLTSENAGDFVGKIIKGGSIQGTFTNKTNPTMTGVTLTSDNIYSDGSYEPNYYIPCNFYGNQSCQTSQHGQPGHGDFFFMTPKPQEYAMVVWAIWDSENDQFVVNENPQYNSHGFQGSFKVDLSLNQNPNIALHDGMDDNFAYNFSAIIRVNSSKAGNDFMVYPLDLSAATDPATAIESVVAGNGEVKSVKFYNVAGIESATPFQGVNIVVTEYTDGSRTTSKMLRK